MVQFFSIQHITYYWAPKFPSLTHNTQLSSFSWIRLSNHICESNQKCRSLLLNSIKHGHHEPLFMNYYIVVVVVPMCAIVFMVYLRHCCNLWGIINISMEHILTLTIASSKFKPRIFLLDKRVGENLVFLVENLVFLGQILVFLVQNLIKFAKFFCKKFIQMMSG